MARTIEHRMRHQAVVTKLPMEYDSREMAEAERWAYQVIAWCIEARGVQERSNDAKAPLPPFPRAVW